MNQQHKRWAVLLNDRYVNTVTERDFIRAAKDEKELQGLTEGQLSLIWEVIDRREDMEAARQDNPQAGPAPLKT